MSVPKLRFPEFKDDGEWDEKPLLEIADRINTRNTSSTVNRVLSNSATDGVVDQRDYFDKDIANKDNLENYFVVDKGDYVYNPRISITAPVGPISKNKIGKGVMSPLYTVFRFKSDKNDFFEHFFKTDLWHKHLKEVSNTGARHDRMAISNDDFMAMPLPYPHPLEQQKIADCLSSLNELISAHNQRLATLKSYRSGLIQHLFPIVGETIPKLRFSEFRKAKEWQVKKTSTLLKKIVKPVDTNPADNYQEIGIRSHGKGIFHKEPVSGQIIGDKRVFWVEEEALILNIVFAWEQAVAVTSLHEKGLIASHRFPMYKAKEGRCNESFIRYLFLTTRGKELLGIASPGGAGRNKTLGQKEFDNLDLMIPSDVKEQELIARTLESVDDMISVQHQKIEALIQHKKGLMQQLFLPGETEV